MWFADNQTGHETAKRPRQTPDWYHVWSPDSRWLLSWRDGGTLRLWETATARSVAQLRIADGVVAAFSPSTDHVYVNVIDENRLLVLDRRPSSRCERRSSWGRASSGSCRISTTGRSSAWHTTVQCCGLYPAPARWSSGTRRNVP